MATTFRSDVTAAILTVLTAQIAATPTQLKRAYTARPGSFPETPCAYIGPRDEALTQSAQVRTPTFTG